MLSVYQVQWVQYANNYIEMRRKEDFYLFIYVYINTSGIVSNKLTVFVANGEGNWMAGHQKGTGDFLLSVFI